MISLSVHRDNKCFASIFVLEYQKVKVKKPVSDEVDLNNPSMLHKLLLDMMSAHKPLMDDCADKKWTLLEELKQAALALMGKDNHVFFLKTKPSENTKFGLSKSAYEDTKLPFNKGGLVISGTKASVNSNKYVIDTPVEWFYHFDYMASNEEVLSAEMPEVNSLPGLNAAIIHPVTNEVHRLKKVIISLNDIFKWSREEIADWLETLDVDLRFQVEK